MQTSCKVSLFCFKFLADLEGSSLGKCHQHTHTQSISSCTFSSINSFSSWLSRGSASGWTPFAHLLRCSGACMLHRIAISARDGDVQASQSLVALRGGYDIISSPNSQEGHLQAPPIDAQAQQRVTSWGSRASLLAESGPAAPPPGQCKERSLSPCGKHVVLGGGRKGRAWKCTRGCCGLKETLQEGRSWGWEWELQPQHACLALFTFCKSCTHVHPEDEGRCQVAVLLSKSDAACWVPCKRGACIRFKIGQREPKIPKKPGTFPVPPALPTLSLQD